MKTALADFLRVYLINKVDCFESTMGNNLETSRFKK
jgi:hypothetical protein